jgi:glycerate kinase
MRIVVAPDSFKGSISAAGAASALAAGWRRARPDDELIELPLADGGEGTLAMLAAAAPGSHWHYVRVSGPATAQVSAAWLEMDGNVAVVELATAAGLTLLSEPSPLTAHSYGVGELIRNALDAGARRVLVALGGSACTDGGTGELAALGARFMDAAGTRPFAARRG